MKKKLNEKKGFTLAELLIVVAIIAVLVAIAIPVFTTQLEKSREATDAANLRAAYAEVVATSLTDADTDCSVSTVAIKQTDGAWSTDTVFHFSDGKASGAADLIIPAPVLNNIYTFSYDADATGAKYSITCTAPSP